MKYLQDLVPGCNKITGTAEMLDEIINYVQSLQKQVEFLSMRLATVTPEIDFNIDNVFAKEEEVEMEDIFDESVIDIDVCVTEISLLWLSMLKICMLIVEEWSLVSHWDAATAANFLRKYGLIVNRAPPPATVQSSGGSMLGGIGSTIAQGLAFGTGSAVAHRAVDSVMGPHTIQHETVGAAAPEAAAAANNSFSDACGMHSKAFQDCITSSGSDISKCQFYMDMLAECKRNSSSGGVRSWSIF